MSNYSSLSRVLSPFQVQTKFEENSLSASPTLNPKSYIFKMKKILTCFVMGKSLDEFTIVVAEEISIDNGWIPIKDFTVGLLKKHIWKEISYDFDGSGIVPNRLNLWKAEIPVSEENRKVLENPEIEYIKQTFKLKKLNQSDMFLDEEVFPDKYTPPHRHIHIIVEPPLPSTTGLKRPNSESHFQNRRMRKLVKTEGPVDITKNFYVPFDILESTYKLEEAINEKVPVDTIDQTRELIKLINDRGARGIKSVVFAGSFAITTILEDGSHQVKKVIEISSQESSQELPQDNLLDDSLLGKPTQSCLQKPEGVPSPLNSAKIIEASDFTKEQHIQFYYDIQENLNLCFNEKVVDDIYSLTNGYAGLEGLLASLCIQYGSNEETLEFNAWNDLFTEFIRNPTKKKISAVKHIEKYLSEPVNSSNNHFIKDAKKLLERFLRKGTLHSSEINDEDLVAIVHLRAIGIIRDMGNEILGFTSNIILDLLSDNYYPVFRRDALARIPHINSPQDFLRELYALLRMAVSYPTYRIFRETRTLEKSEKKCDVWICNNKEYGIECKVDKVSEKEIKKAAEQAIGYTKGRDKVCVHILYSKTSRSAQIFRNNMDKTEIPFALS
ncbi:unnamed protein product [Rhizophagus irregularis]|nr:unnamed protein product [Rhizophagus irregularis]